MLTGRCDCGAVRFEVDNARASVTMCHCTQCRRTSGHVWASTKANLTDIHFITDSGLTWYSSSEHVRRGFCQICGSALFYRKSDDAGMGIAAGCLDTPTGLHLGRHIHTSTKGDYYQIAEDVPRMS